jgi:Asp-tRNA(Asn)/Glu-tRNA(Gln) amidotransferase A subunit family amidase
MADDQGDAPLDLVADAQATIPTAGVPDLTPGQIAGAEAVAGITFTESERDLMLEDLRESRVAYAQIRSTPLPNSLASALVFDPRVPGAPLGSAPHQAAALSDGPATGRPDDLEALAFAPITQLAALIRTRQVSAVELTEMYLARLKRFDPLLHCVVTLTEERARAQARAADREIAAGRYRGPLHGIPWGAKDLLATRGIPTTWGAAPYRDQVPDFDATVVERLDAAGAILVAKLSVGELAWGDVWFGGMTRNPWNPEEGSSGSSAGSAAAVASGLVGFAIGTETEGSIISPCTRCGVSGLRPTFGRVSRHGAMALTWSMDKIGPIARTVDDCALVFAAIYGPDGKDRTVVDYPFGWPVAQSLRDLRIGYLESAFAEEYAGRDLDRATLDLLRVLGADLVPIALPVGPIESLSFILQAEAAAAFDDLVRSDQDDLLVRQIRKAWPNELRRAHLIPAVEYIQANRLRMRLMADMATLLQGIDVYVAPSFDEDNLLLTNLTGHPAVVVPNGRTPDGAWNSITFTGRLYGEAATLGVARIVQEATGFHQEYPTLADKDES